MQLVDDWKKVLLTAWSSRLAALAALFSALEAIQLVLPYFDGILPPKTMTVLALVAAVGAIGARIVQQLALHPEEPEPVQVDAFGKIVEQLAPPPRGTCVRGPLGWWCSRELGHTGPCALHREDVGLLRTAMKDVSQ
jgi:hypothetical protein